MIKVLLKKEKEKIIFFEIKGHSNLSERGTDIVCAAVSAVSVMSLNGIIEYLNYNNLDYKIDEGYVSLDVSNTDDERINAILNSMHIYLEELAKQYPKNLKLKVMEV